jgi:hypothetical protein
MLVHRLIVPLSRAAGTIFRQATERVPIWNADQAKTPLESAK